MRLRWIAGFGLFVALWSLAGLAASGAATAWIGVALGVAVAALAAAGERSRRARRAALVAIAALAVQAAYKLGANMTPPLDGFGLAFFAVLTASSVAAMLHALVVEAEGAAS